MILQSFISSSLSPKYYYALWTFNFDCHPTGFISAALSSHKSYVVTPHNWHWVLRSMRFKILMALWLAALAFFSHNVAAILDGGEGLSAEQLIGASIGVYIPYTGIPENPQASRDLWSKESGINFTSPGKLPESGSTPQASRSNIQTGDGLAYQTESNLKSDSENATSPAASPIISLSPAAEMAGNWSFRLRDSKTAVLALTLYQSDSAIFGTGSINDGGDSLRVLASGSLVGDGLNLDVMTSGTVRLYRLALSGSDSSLSGEYRAYSTDGMPWMGIAEGTKIT